MIQIFFLLVPVQYNGMNKRKVEFQLFITKKHFFLLRLNNFLWSLLDVMVIVIDDDGKKVSNRWLLLPSVMQFDVFM